MKNYKLVKTKEDVLSLINYIKEQDYIAFDTETNGLNTRTSKVVGFSVTAKENTAFYFPVYCWNKDTSMLEEVSISGVSAKKISTQVLSFLLEHSKNLIMHNGSFDIRVIKSNYGIDLTPVLHTDTILLIHTLYEEGPFKLKDFSIKFKDELGFDPDAAANEEQIILKENVKNNGGSVTKVNFEIYKADIDVLSNYACADTDLTYKIFNLLIKDLENQNLKSFFYEEEVMPLYREVTIPMEEEGVLLDIDLIEKSKSNIKKDIEKIEKEILECLKQMKQFKKWLFNQANEKFPPSNKGSYAQAVCDYYKLNLPITESGKYSITKKNIDTLDDSPAKKFLINNIIEEIETIDAVKIAIGLWIKYNGECININSKHQVGDFVFNYLRETPISKTETGLPQFDDQIIEVLSDKYDWIKKLRVYNRLVKIKSTYMDRFLDNQENGRYYFYYKQHGTISGRYGSDAQQLPRVKEAGQDDDTVVHYNNLIRSFMIADRGFIFVDCDYEQLEPKCFSDVSGDYRLQEIFYKNYDFYSTIAIRSERLNDLSADKKSDNYLGKKNKQLRTKWKAISLAVPYGLQEYALSKTLDISIDAAKKLIDDYLSAFPDLKKWMDYSEDQANNLGYVKTKTGRVRHLDKVKDIYSQYGAAFLDNKFKKQMDAELGFDESTTIFRDYKNGLNNARNFQIQGLAASIVNRAAIQINRKLKENGISGKVIAQIHDQIITKVDETKKDIAASIIQDCMENTTTLSVPLTAPPELSINWRDGH